MGSGKKSILPLHHSSAMLHSAEQWLSDWGTPILCLIPLHVGGSRSNEMSTGQPSPVCLGNLPLEENPQQEPAMYCLLVQCTA